MDEKHFIMALNAQYLACTTQRSNGTAYDKFENNREFRVERQTGNGTEIMSQVWAQRAAVVWQQPGYQTQQPQNDPRIIQQDTTLESGKLKRVDYEYDGFNNTTRVKEYNLGNGSPGSLRRQTERTYLTSQNSNCYTNLNGIDSTCGSFVPPQS